MHITCSVNVSKLCNNDNLSLHLCASNNWGIALAFAGDLEAGDLGSRCI